MNDSLAFAQSWYAATAHAGPPHAALAGDCQADVAIIGGGATGLSAALHLAQRGASVALLEAGRIGHGASGRNGGQIIPGLRLGAADLVARFGAEQGGALFHLALSARDLVVDLVARHGIDCDLALTGHLTTAVRPRDLDDFAREAEAAARLGYRGLSVLEAPAAQAAVASSSHGALLDAGGGHFHTLNYTLGLARAAAAAGAHLREHNAVTRLERAASGVRLHTPNGIVTAAQAIVAGDALLGPLNARVHSRIMPVANYIVTTDVLPDGGAGLIPGNQAVSDSRFVVNYFRRTPDGRLMFGGGERYSPRPPADMAAFVRPFLERSFPMLAGIRIAHAWGGLVSITRSRLPDIGRDGPVLWAHGYSGQGAVLSTLGGALLAEAALGDETRFTPFAAVAPPGFPGGALLRGPLHVLGMLWYALRDRTG
ncbi:NAD(P)/FAD-dependent oxidoreductase [Sandarakinorhabdus limnophila]|uniref:NAD(P)/FAD-dependent oxidoreductase n=1 Tax=Sandarakinorhabdus limnophila TaxID=210512 RepID=UPI0026F16BDA|nr:FAD-binding oxidoreductase [Sandarakinorhabdus limnophila]